MVGENVKCQFRVSIVSAQKFMQVGDIHLLLCDVVMCAHMKVSHMRLKDKAQWKAHRVLIQYGGPHKCYDYGARLHGFNWIWYEGPR